MHKEQREQICKVFKEQGFFLPTTIERFLLKNSYKMKKQLADEVLSANRVYYYLTAQSYDVSKQRKKAFRELCIMELQELIKQPEVISDSNLNQYAHIMLGLYDGSYISNRIKLEGIVNRLELKILHTISVDNAGLKPFLKIACMYSNRFLVYSREDKKALEKLCTKH